MGNSISVNRIIIKIGDVEISLTPDDARELREVLASLLGEDKVTYVPYPVPSHPPYYPYPRWTWTASSDSEAIVTTSSSTVYAS